MNDWTPRERHAFAAGFAYALACAAHGARPEQLPAYLNVMTRPLKLDYGLLLEILEGAPPTWALRAAGGVRHAETRH